MASTNILWYTGGLFSLKRGKKIKPAPVKVKLSAEYTHIRPWYTHLSRKSEEGPKRGWKRPSKVSKVQRESEKLVMWLFRITEVSTEV